MEQEIVMYTDGGSRNNPGPAAVGVYIETLDKKFGEYIGEKTNNEAEYEALILGLKKVKNLLGKEKSKKIKLDCKLDSELIVKQLSHEYKLKEKHIQDLFIQVWNLMLDFKEVNFSHVRRENNKIADSIVNDVLDNRSNQSSLI